MNLFIVGRFRAKTGFRKQLLLLDVERYGGVATAQDLTSPQTIEI